MLDYSPSVSSALVTLTRMICKQQFYMSRVVFIYL